KRAYCLKTQPATGETYPKSDLFNKADSRDKIVAQIKLLTPQKLADFFHQAVVEPQGMAILSQISGSQNGKAEYVHPEGWKVWENVSALQQTMPLMSEKNE
ncbi:hypothetical protein, partial [Escherichia coli]|uniref:hypothetical protein n=1 Tax=Escherichia coli TaxID=562 RepID=UPI002576B6D5